MPLTHLMNPLPLTFRSEDATFITKSKFTAGSMAHSFIVHCQEDDETYALKRIRCCDPKDEAMFQRECDVLRKVQHPRVLKLRAVFTDQTVETDGHVITQEDSQEMSYKCIVSEYCSGGNLHDAYRQGREIEDREWMSHVNTWACDIAEALSFVHLKGVLHVDLKSDNVFLDSERRAVVGDFGLAHFLESMYTMDFVPTDLCVYCSPPESVADSGCREVYGIYSDSWQYGLLLCELITRSRPDVGTSRPLCKSKERLELWVARVRHICEQTGYTHLYQLVCETVLMEQPRNRPLSREIFNRLKHQQQIAQIERKREENLQYTERMLREYRNQIEERDNLLRAELAENRQYMESTLREYRNQIEERDDLLRAELAENRQYMESTLREYRNQIEERDDLLRAVLELRRVEYPRLLERLSKSEDGLREVYVTLVELSMSFPHLPSCRAMLTLLELHKHVQGLQSMNIQDRRDALCAFEVISSDKENRVLIAIVNSIPPLIQFLKIDDGDRGSIHDCRRALCILFALSTEDVARRRMQAACIVSPLIGIIRSVLGMDDGLVSNELLNVGCSLLSILSIDPSQHQVMIDCGLVNVLVSVMYHWHDSYAREKAVEMVCSLAQSGGGLIWSLGGSSLDHDRFWASNAGLDIAVEALLGDRSERVRMSAIELLMNVDSSDKEVGFRPSLLDKSGRVMSEFAMQQCGNVLEGIMTMTAALAKRVSGTLAGEMRREKSDAGDIDDVNIDNIACSFTSRGQNVNGNTQSVSEPTSPSVRFQQLVVTLFRNHRRLATLLSRSTWEHIATVVGSSLGIKTEMLTDLTISFMNFDPRFAAKLLRYAYYRQTFLKHYCDEMLGTVGTAETNAACPDRTKSCNLDCLSAGEIDRYGVGPYSVAGHLGNSAALIQSQSRGAIAMRALALRKPMLQFVRVLYLHFIDTGKRRVGKLEPDQTNGVEIETAEQYSSLSAFNHSSQYSTSNADDNNDVNVTNEPVQRGALLSCDLQCEENVRAPICSNDAGQNIVGVNDDPHLIVDQAREVSGTDVSNNSDSNVVRPGLMRGCDPEEEVEALVCSNEGGEDATATNVSSTPELVMNGSPDVHEFNDGDDVDINVIKIEACCDAAAVSDASPLVADQAGEVFATDASNNRDSTGVQAGLIRSCDPEEEGTGPISSNEGGEDTTDFDGTPQSIALQCHETHKRHHVRPGASPDPGEHPEAAVRGPPCSDKATHVTGDASDTRTVLCSDKHHKEAVGAPTFSNEMDKDTKRDDCSFVLGFRV